MSDDFPTKIEFSRREMLARMGAGLVVITIPTVWGLISPAEARTRGARMNHFDEMEASTLEELGEALLPGAKAAGIAHYIDAQLSSSQSMLFLKYMDYPGKQESFYKEGLRSLNSFCKSSYSKLFRDCTAEQKVAIVREISAKNPYHWDGPPAPLFYFVIRNDAVDVYYGTMEGFQRLQIPYMAHIKPPAKW